jgi:DNA invertase Pin-like site-specific DNA recombinase
MRAALYLRVSTRDQDTARQERELRQTAVHRGWEIVRIYRDNGISGAKGRDQRPALDDMMKAAIRREFDVVMAWSVDRLSRSVKDLVTFLHELHAAGVDLFLYQQAIDTTTPMGKAMFQIAGVFAELERAIITERIHSGIAKAREQGTRSGKAIGRPRVPDRIREEIRHAHAAGGISLRKLAKAYDVSLGTVQAVLRSE